MNQPLETLPPDLLRSLAASSPAHLATLRDRPGQQAAREELLDVAICTTDTPVGELLLAATTTGLARIAFANEDRDHVLEQLSRVLGPRILTSPRALDQARRELDEYFARSRTSFTIPLDWSLTHGFRRTVQEYLPRIAYGRTSSYKDVADAVGNARAIRAVGTACATNPLPIVVPCHRVLRSDGSLGGYLGGLDSKTLLLELERG
ncbi:methylated-DNA--[protein]-cysteine S-methyltransferase [Hoyosella sp. G463]|uniref:Methylated-DNA--protein-cysteine methyltransferase n=1 Tax=Lolliginicoccus lacisalsi TaxID=2742202 RepID=A0A927JAG9_9ACTN|nr:methylated-DNA--[protein]-cysteine S-methyltransferase [Lolliginicoccus lacisalsi]MBD8505604.1 methylated-DNA--[protein]-cysteine S-methyltransferase [Lolliginicoccus lacisalsi]